MRPQLAAARPTLNPPGLPRGLQGMLELTVLAVMNRMVNGGFEPLTATRIVAADLSAVRALASDATTQQDMLAGLPMRLRVQAIPSASLRLVVMRLCLGEHDVLSLHWSLTPRRGTIEVDLAAQFHVRGPAMRVLLMLGGRRWLTRRLDGVLSSLADRTLRAAEGIDEIAWSAPLAAPRAQPT